HTTIHLSILLSLHSFSLSSLLVFFLTDPPPPYIYTLSLTTLFRSLLERAGRRIALALGHEQGVGLQNDDDSARRHHRQRARGRGDRKSTSELQSRGHLVCRLLLEKKKRDIH